MLETPARSPQEECLSTSGQADLEALTQMIRGAQTAQLAYVMAKLELADLLRSGPQCSAVLAAATETHPEALRRVLRGLASVGLCVEVAEDQFGLTALGAYLQTDRADSLHARALFSGEVLFPLWGDLLQTVQSGEDAMTRVFGMPGYRYLAEHPAVGRLFNQAMADSARDRLWPIVHAYDFGRYATIVDVGGGSGALLAFILEAYPQPLGVVYDFPGVVAQAAERIRRLGLAARCTAEGGDAREHVPAGGDLYVLSNVLCSLSDQDAGAVLRNCRLAMGMGGRLAIAEWIMPGCMGAAGDYDFWDAAANDLVMLAATGGTQGGRVRTERELRELLTAAGLHLAEIIPTGSSVKIIEALPS